MSHTVEAAGFPSILVPTHLGVDSPDTIRFAASLAQRFGSRLTGIAAQDFAMPYFGEGAIAIDAAVVDDAKREAAANLARAEAVFRAAVAPFSDIVWRAAITASAAFAMEEARAADLVVLGRSGPDDAGQGVMGVSPADLVMGIGRPVLIVPPRVTELTGRHVVIAWKDTREARRAVSDALPFLKSAEQVFVLAVGADAADQGAESVAEHLRLHGVASRAAIRESSGFVIDEIVAYAEQERADLIVAGAYGHSRMREWLFGGVTQDLLETAPIPCLMSH